MSVARPVTPSPRDVPAYPLGEAARYARVAPATLRSWVVGRPYATRVGTRHSRALIRLADPHGRLLSFNNLVEVHVLRALRTEHGTPIDSIRKALSYAQGKLGIDNLLLSRELATAGGELFLDRYGELISLERSGQMAMRAILLGFLKRVERDDDALPRRLFPFVHGEGSRNRPLIAIDPAVGFGRPIVASRGIATRTIVERIDAGESMETLAEDYELSVEELEEAIIYERAA
jgi:uncharacterized protein (DUF433 family)